MSSVDSFSVLPSVSGLRSASLPLKRPLVSAYPTFKSPEFPVSAVQSQRFPHVHQGPLT